MMADTPLSDITAKAIPTLHTPHNNTHTIFNCTQWHKTEHNLHHTIWYATLPHTISFLPQNALLSLGNPLQTLKRMSELIGLLCAQLDVLCRRNEESIGPATAVAVVSNPRQRSVKSLFLWFKYMYFPHILILSQYLPISLIFPHCILRIIRRSHRKLGLRTLLQSLHLKADQRRML